jgi:Na+-transporting NADH:ubiquinone oxidoreductase subunit F
MNIQKRPFIIQSIERHNTVVKAFTLKPKTPEKIVFKPGQFVTLTIENPKCGPRSYSISSSPLMDDAIELTIQKVGVFTTELFKKEEGDEIIVQGPYGNFVLQEPVPADVVLLAGGTGIAPMMSMLRHIQDSGMKTRVTLIYSVRTQLDILHKDELTHRSQKFADHCYIQTLTREPEDSGWQGHRGRIGEETIKRHVRNLKNAVYYVCGPEPFVKGVEETLLFCEIPAASIKKEQWG